MVLFGDHRWCIKTFVCCASLNIVWNIRGDAVEEWISYGSLKVNIFYRIMQIKMPWLSALTGPSFIWCYQRKRIKFLKVLTFCQQMYANILCQILTLNGMQSSQYFLFVAKCSNEYSNFKWLHLPFMCWFVHRSQWVCVSGWFYSFRFCPSELLGLALWEQ